MILVTGGAGYIGAHTMVDLLEHNLPCISVDNFSKSFSDILEGVEKITHQTVKNYAINLCDFALSEKIFKENKIETVIHFAAYKSVAESVSNPYIYFQNNLQSLNNVLELCRNYDVKNFIFSSSCSVYGNATDLPVTENTMLQEAQSPYATTKQIGEMMIRNYCASFGINAVLLRYFNPGGAHISNEIGEVIIGKPTYLIPGITQFANEKIAEFFVWGTDYNTRDGSCIRDFIHVSDIAHAHTLAVDFLNSKNENGVCEIFNLGTGNGVTVLEAIQAFEKVSSKKLKIQLAPKRAGDVAAIFADNKKATEILNWKCQYNIEDIMRTAWAWELKN